MPSIKTWIFFVFSTNVKKTKYILFGGTRGFHKFLYRNIERVFNLLRQRSRGNILNSLLFKKLYTRHTNNIRPEQFTTGPLLFNFWVFFENTFSSISFHDPSCQQRKGWPGTERSTWSSCTLSPLLENTRTIANTWWRKTSKRGSIQTCCWSRPGRTRPIL